MMKHMTFREMFDEVEKHPDYWAELAMLHFSEEVLAAMREQSVTRAELARRLGTSQGYVTRLLNGTSNLTLATMSKMAFVLGLELRTSLEPMAKAWSSQASSDTSSEAAGAG
jgi:transcriptional regulator with XRE-family HTH domain